MKNFILWLLVYAAAIAAALVVIGLIFATPEWISEHARWVMWILIPVAVAAYFACLWRWYRETVEQEAAEQEEGEDNALL